MKREALDDISREMEKTCITIMNTSVKPLLTTGEKFAFFLDPVLNLNRNRVNAEIYKSVIRLDKAGIKLLDEEIHKKIINWLLNTQNQDGSWNEIHSNYDQPSALLTSFVGEALLMTNENRKIPDITNKAKDYVLSQELSPGYFKKSAHNYTDCLNVNATCGAFLAQYAAKYDDDVCREAARRAAHQICQHQFSNGSFPYTTNTQSYPHKYHLYVPCIHYQGVTLFFLSKIHHVLEDEWIQRALEKGGEWLASVQKKDGYFNWSKSGLMYAYYLAAAYAFAANSFLYVSQWNNKFLENAKLSLSALSENTNGTVNRWEKASIWSMPKGITDALRSSSIGNYPISHRFFRFGYATYKQFARRRYSQELEDKPFKKLSSLINIKSTWIEPSKNYPDLFSTSEALDCLSDSLLFLTENGGGHVL